MSMSICPIVSKKSIETMEAFNFPKPDLSQPVASGPYLNIPAFGHSEKTSYVAIQAKMLNSFWPSTSSYDIGVYFAYKL